jgi:2-iminobutanoate/2-iminopropanoate deaminase
MSDGQGAPPVGPYTPVVRAGGWLVCSGQVGQAGGKLVEGGTAAQLTQAVANLDALLRAEGASLASIIKTTVFLADIADYAVMNDAYTAAFGQHRPARSAVAVRGLPLGAAVGRNVEMSYTWLERSSSRSSSSSCCRSPFS